MTHQPAVRVRRRAAVLAIVASVPLAANPVAAQLPSASAAALGTGDNYTALARGYNAVAWNPAGLAMPGNPRLSLALFPVRAVGGLGPVTLGDVAEYEGIILPDDVRARWLERIAAEGGQRGSAGADVTYLALSVGRLGLQLATSAYAKSNLGPEAAELLLYGNAGRTGDPLPYTLRASTLDAAVTSTVAVSYAHPLPLPVGPPNDRAFAVGATLNYTVGNAVLHGQDMGSVLASDATSIRVEFPVLSTDSASGQPDNGRGMGLDLGAAWQGGAWAVGLAIQNVFNTFEWDASKLSYRAGWAYFDADSSGREWGPQPLSAAPAELDGWASGLTFKPALALGVAVTPVRTLTLSADMRRRLGDGLGAGSGSHVGLGVEFRPLGLIPLRAGFARAGGGYQAGGGLGVHVGWVNLGVSAACRWAGVGDGVLGAFGLSFGAM
jgi:hypothetical protein